MATFHVRGQMLFWAILYYNTI